MVHARGWRLTLLFCTLLIPGVRAEEGFTIRVSPEVCYEGCDVRVVVRVPPDAGNRALTIEADSPMYFRGSEIDLSGESAALLHTLTLHSPPSGEYVIRAKVARANSTTRSTQRTLHVIGPLEGLPPSTSCAPRCGAGRRPGSRRQ
jgi:hypothetical protein